MTEVFQVIVILTPPTEHRSQAFAYGFYIVEGYTVTMTDQDGNPRVDPQGNTYTAKLEGETPRTIAARMVRRIETSRLRRRTLIVHLFIPRSAPHRNRNGTPRRRPDERHCAGPTVL